MEIANKIEIIDLALYLLEYEALIISDIHLGYEDYFIRQGVLLPKQQYMKTITRLRSIFSQLKKENKKVKTIIINGDLKHEFGTISKQEWQDTNDLVSFLESKCEEIVLVKGNHDMVLGSLASKIKVKETVNFGNILVIHGHKIPPNLSGRTIIIGHEHPCVGLTDGVIKEKYKCFLKGRWHTKNLLVLPSFNLMSEGTDVLSNRILSPFLKQNLDDFEVWLVSNNVRYFGKLKNLKK